VPQCYITYQDEYFYALVPHRKNQKKQRQCLKCHTFFESLHFGHRLCAICDIANKRVGVKGREMVPQK